MRIAKNVFVRVPVLWTAVFVLLLPRLGFPPNIVP